ncbi:MAG: dihydrolipoamide acetyltransferase family protein, partial [Candidatus Promineifilaceae bacterium]
IALLLEEGEAPAERGPEDRQPAFVADGVATLSEPAMGLSQPDRQLTGQNGPEQRPRRLPSTPAARRRAQELAIDWRLATPTGPFGAIKERDVIRLANDRQDERPAKTQISPVAQRLAEATGVTIQALIERYPGQRIERAQVEEYLREALLRPRLETDRERGTAGGREEPLSRREPVGRLRRVIKERMAYSAQTYAPVTLTTEADASELVRIRTGLKADPQMEVVPSYNAFLLKLTARALQEHAYLNASLDGDEIIYWQTVNVGLAVDTDRGLVVPVIQNAAAKSVHDLAIELADLLPRAKAGKALPDELSGGTFTITNLGAFNIDAFTPIINPPESAVLGVGRLIDKWVVVDKEPSIRTMLSLSLTFDHRLVDGAQAARFLDRIRQFVEQPYLWLV